MSETPGMEEAVMEQLAKSLETKRDRISKDALTVSEAFGDKPIDTSSFSHGEVTTAPGEYHLNSRSSGALEQLLLAVDRSATGSRVRPEGVGSWPAPSRTANEAITGVGYTHNNSSETVSLNVRFDSLTDGKGRTLSVAISTHSPSYVDLRLTDGSDNVATSRYMLDQNMPISIVAEAIEEVKTMAKDPGSRKV